MVFFNSIGIILGLRFEMGTDWYEYSKDFYRQNELYKNTHIEEFLRIKYF